MGSGGSVHSRGIGGESWRGECGGGFLLGSHLGLDGLSYVDGWSEGVRVMGYALWPER